MMMITFRVEGKPVPQGSKKPMVITGRNADIDAAINFSYLGLEQATTEATRESIRGIIQRLEAVGRWPVRKSNRWLINTLDDNAAKLKPWRDKIAAAARAAYDGPQLYGPVSVDATFTFVRPAAHWRTGKRNKELQSWAPIYHTSAPDRDKLLRAVLDALTQSGIIVDDKIVVATPGYKQWSDIKGGGDGVRIGITEIRESDECRVWAKKRYERKTERC